MQREDGAVLFQPAYLAADADDPLLAGAQVALHIAVVLGAVRFGNQQDILIYRKAALSMSFHAGHASHRDRDTP